MHVVRVWDLPTRCFHWALTMSVVGLIATGNIGGNAMVWHMRLGYTVLALLAFRVMWGWVGGHWSRFAQFPLGPRSLWAYLRGDRSPRLRLGHNPLGSWSVLAMLLALTLQAISGLFADDEIAFFGPLTALASSDTVHMATWYHKQVGRWAVLGLVALHLLALVYHAGLRREPLVRAMFNGDKAAPNGEFANTSGSEDNARSRTLALALFVVCAFAVTALVWYGWRQGMAGFA